MPEESRRFGCFTEVATRLAVLSTSVGSFRPDVSRCLDPWACDGRFDAVECAAFASNICHHNDRVSSLSPAPGHVVRRLRSGVAESRLKSLVTRFGRESACFVPSASRRLGGGVRCRTLLRLKNYAQRV